MYDTILVPTDGSEHAVRAAEHARALADVFDATFHVVHAVDVQAAAGPFAAGGVDEEFVERLEAEGEEAIDAVVDALGAGDEVRTAVIRGDPREAVLEYAGEHGADLLAMGTHGRTGVERYVAGSATEHVLRTADVPVLTARATDGSRIDGDYDEVLVPTDGSESAAAAVDHALEIARETGARVHALHVVDVNALAFGREYSAPTAVLDNLARQGERATEEIAGRARDAGLEAVAEVRQGYPASDLLEYADEAGVDLVAMGTAGQTGLSRYLLGSTTERVIRHADVPVLAVNARERAAD